MAWIGGIVSKGNTSQDNLRTNLALMMEAACPSDKPSTGAYSRYASLVINDMRGQALVEISHRLGGVPPEHSRTNDAGELALIYDGHLYGHPRTTRPGRSQGQYTANQPVARSFVNLLDDFDGKLEQRVTRALTNLDGDYALAVSDADRIVLSRNPLGTKPLYFAENGRLSAFASNKKPLWNMGLKDIRPLKVGMLAVINQEGVSTSENLRVHEQRTTTATMDRAVNAYQRTLKSSVDKRLGEMSYLPKVGVLLSGGVDSCLIAKMVCDAASDLRMEVVAYTAGLPDSPDVRFAQEFARESGIKHKVEALNIDEVERYIPKVIEAIEDSDFVQVETGIGLYAAADLARRDGAMVLFSGQGPDELWGGYSWYPRVLAREGRQELCQRMWDDLTRVDIETLDRENKIALAHGVELVFPYLDIEIVTLALSVSSELKVTSGEDRLGKHPHRQLASKMGISDKYANREKTAIQHGTGIHGLLDNVARRNGFDPALVRDIGYKNEDIGTERMGSSSRYGYRYIAKRLWQVPRHVQLFFHASAYEQGLLDKPVSDRVGHFLKKARVALGS